MSCVAGIDGTPGGWAAVIMDGGRSSIRKIASLSNLIDSIRQFDIIAIDVPIGLLDCYQVGGRGCDRLARRRLGQARGRSVFPAPARCVLEALNMSPLPVADKHRPPVAGQRPKWERDQQTDVQHLAEDQRS